MTVTGGGTKTGGAEPFGNAARQGLARERDAGRWISRPGADPASVRVDVAEAAALQTFPRDYPWMGTKGERFQRIGDAVPPQLASEVIAEVAEVTAGQDAATEGAA